MRVLWKDLGQMQRSSGMLVFSRRYFVWAVMAAGLGFSSIIRDQDGVEERKANGGFVILNGWIVRRSEIPEKAISKALSVDL